jgi:hypothetical protein
MEVRGSPFVLSTPTLTLPPREAVSQRENGKNVMLNLFQHLIKSNSYKTLKRVQGDKKTIATQSLEGGRILRDKFQISLVGSYSPPTNVTSIATISETPAVRTGGPQTWTPLVTKTWVRFCSLYPQLTSY